MAASLNNIGIAYDEKGDYALSLVNYFQSLKLYELQSSDPFDVAMVLGNIGIVYKKQKEYEKVLEYYGKALDIYEEQESVFGQTVTKGNISSVLLLTGGYQEAIEYASEALEGYNSLGYSRYVPYMQHNLAIAYDSLGQSNKASGLFLQSIEGHKSTDNKYELSSSLIGYASNQRNTGNYESGVDNAQEALSLAEEIGAKEFITQAKLELSKNLAKLGDHKRAYQHLLSYSFMKDSIFEDAKTRQIFELQTQYETEKKEQQIELQEAQLSEQDALLNLNRTFLIASVITILLVLAIALLNRNRIKKKQKLLLQEERLNTQEATINATISSQEKERARYARDLHDGFGQMISILNMNLQNLVGDPKPKDRQKVFEESEKVINEMYDELRSICFDLMPQTLVKNGLSAALEEFATRINAVDQIYVETNFFGIEDRLEEIQEISLYRISQEWINNILKYSDASKITLQITRDEDEMNLIIEDDGMGFDKQLLLKSKGNGWRNIQTRTKLIGGEIELDTTSGKKGNTLILNYDIQKISIRRKQNTLETV
jgi:signal transduction histidine kinase